MKLQDYLKEIYCKITQVSDSIPYTISYIHNS